MFRGSLLAIGRPIPATFVASATAGAASGRTAVITVPGTAQVGDLLIVMATGVASLSKTTGGGAGAWTTVSGFGFSLISQNSGAMWKICEAGDISANITFDGTTFVDITLSLHVLRHPSGAPITPAAKSSAVATGTSVSPAAFSPSLKVVGELGLYAHDAGGSLTLTSAPATFGASRTSLQNTHLHTTFADVGVAYVGGALTFSGAGSGSRAAGIIELTIS